MEGAGDRPRLSQVVNGRGGRFRSSAGAGVADADVERIHWIEFGKEHWSEFSEATDPSGHFESNSSKGHKEYQDRLRAIAMREEGVGKAQIAADLGRSEHFVQTWWRKDPKEVPRPPGVHAYLKTEYWRDVQIVRGFGRGLGIYDEVVSGSEWQQQMASGSDFRHGGRVIKYDKEGRMKPMGNQHAKGGYEAGHMPNLDRLTQKMLAELSIQDRVLTRPGLLWYPDGSADAIPHRHECWTALMSFGSPRILTVDGTPVMLRDGDLIVFGTQRHGVPKMHQEGGTFDEYGGRVSAVFFFMPQGQQAQGANPWRPIVDPVDTPSRQLVAWSRDRDLGARHELEGLRAGPLAAAVAQLGDLGFSEEEAAAALQAVGFDVEQAAEVLLSGGASALLLSGSSQGGRQQELAALYARLESLHCHTCAAGAPAPAPTSVAGEAECSGDAALALRLQQDEGSVLHDDIGAVLAQIQELEREEAGDVDPGALRAQFAQYEEMLDRADADQWDGRGDLMASMSKREHLHIEQQDPVQLYAFGCGRLGEKDFFELLSLHSIRVLYDLRADPEATPGRHFHLQHLAVACKSRAVVYRHVALGRDGAYGILKHLKEDEGRNTLAELIWQAQRKRTAFLGADADWRQDHRQAIAMRLREAGHTVLHVLSDGSTEAHPELSELPDFIQSEEARLRKLEKQRLDGEPRPQKSAASRSTEVVAQKLTKPQQVIDAGAELRKATNQTELCRIQRRLADLQRKSEGADAKAGLGPKVLNATKWVKEEAEQQRQNLAAGKTKDGKERGVKGDGPPPAYVWLGTGGTSGGNPVLAAGSAASGSRGSSGSDAAPDVCLPLMVQCRECSTVFDWEQLEAQDGRCPECALQCAQAEQDSAPQSGTVLDETSVQDIALSVPGRAEQCCLPPSGATPCGMPARGAAGIAPESKPQATCEGSAVAAGAKSAWRARRHHQRSAT